MGRSPCCENGHTNKGTWTKEEDQLLISYINANGHGSWRALPKAAGLQRCGKSCRLRWINYLRPDLKRGNFTEEDVELMIELHSKLGNKWSEIAREMEGRTDNEIKNYWNTHIKPMLIARGIDPHTHQPINAGDAQSDTCITSSRRRGRKATIVAQAPPTTALKSPLSLLAVAASRTQNSAEDAQSSGISTDDEERRMPDLNLSLTLSLPPYAESEAAPPPRSAAAQTICMCCQLGFHDYKGRCGCTP